MHERKTLMAKLSDAFVVLPGGYGTFDEMCEMATWDQSGIHAKPLVIVNVEGYFDGFLAQLDRARRRRVDQARASRVAGARRARSTQRWRRLRAWQPPPVPQWLLDAAAATLTGDAAAGGTCRSATLPREASAACSPISTTRCRHRHGSRRGRTRPWSDCAPRASSSSRSPAGRPAGATTSRACGRWMPSSAKTARSTCATTTRGASWSSALPRTRRASAKSRTAGSDRRAASCARCPGAALASDQHFRETDLAIDFCEDVPPLPRAAVDRIVALMQAEGMTAKVSSIHVNGWFGDYDKLAMTRSTPGRGLRDRISTRDVRDSCSPATRPNDAPMFGFFPNSVGVANVRPFLDRIATPPAYITQREAGAGFVELADFLIGVT